MHPLHGSKLKLGRAEYHLNTLRASVEQFIRSNPYSFGLRANPKHPDYALHARINRDPPEEWGCIVGDFAHNARSALDLLIYELSDLTAGDKRRTRLQFPIFETSADYAKKTEEYLAGVKLEHRKIIEGHQPYMPSRKNKGDALAMLQDINNRDKHRIVVMVGAVANLEFFKFDSRSTLPDWIKVGQGGSLRISGSFNFGNGFTGTKVGNGLITEDGAMVARMTIPQPGQASVTPEPEIAIQFNLNDQRTNGRPAMDVLASIHHRVEEILIDFDKVLPTASHS